MPGCLHFHEPEPNPIMITSLSLHNFKGVTAKYNFRQGTLIQGLNFSGKSAIEQAARLLVIGYVPDVAKTDAGIKMLASDYPMQLSATIDANVPIRTPSIAFEKVKGVIKKTVDLTLAEDLDEATRVLFDPTIFFGLSDAARITKAVELVQSEGVTLADIQSAIAGILGIDITAPTKKEPMWPVYEKWLKQADAKTVSDFLSTSETFWKEQRKIVNAEKSRMQSTVEGVADLNAAEKNHLPPRHEVDAIIIKSEEDRMTLRTRIVTAEALASAASRAAQRRADIAPLAASLAEKIQAEAKKEAALVEADKSVENCEKAVSEKRAEYDRLQKLSTEAARQKKQAEDLTRESSKKDALTSARDTLTTEIQRLNEELDAAYRELNTAKSARATAEQEAAAPKPVRVDDEVRTDEFTTGAAVGVKYLASCVIELRDNGAVEIVSIADWRKLAEETDESEEQARLKEYELAQAVTEAAEALEAAEKAVRDKVIEINEQNRQLNEANRVLSKAEIAAEQLAALPATSPNAPAHTELIAADRALVAATEALNAAKTLLKQIREDHTQVRDAVASARAAADELARLDAEPASAVTSPEEIATMKQEVEIIAKTLSDAKATLDLITAAEHDQKRINEAAAKREAVESEYKLLGKVIDVLTQKKTELVSGSIDKPLAIANKLATGILKGPLVFEEGEIGMRVGDSFRSARAFSGSETAIVMIGLTAGLAAKSVLRVLLLDEIGRFDVRNASQLITNLCGMVDDGDIDQFILFGPRNRELTDSLSLEQSSSRLDIINV
jgi:hypothetical protein